MHSRLLGIVFCVALVALVLTGCGGGKMTTNGTPGDESEMPLLEKWQRFANRNPTLSMTSEEIEEAWTAAAERTTHYVIFNYRVFPTTELGEGPIPIAESIESIGGVVPTEIEFVYAPVMEHNSIPVAEIKYRYTDEDENYGETKNIPLRCAELRRVAGVHKF